MDNQHPRKNWHCNDVCGIGIFCPNIHWKSKHTILCYQYWEIKSRPSGIGGFTKKSEPDSTPHLFITAP